MLPYLKRVTHSIFYHYDYAKNTEFLNLTGIQGTINARFARGNLCNMLSSGKVTYIIKS